MALSNKLKQQKKERKVAKRKKRASSGNGGASFSQNERFVSVDNTPVYECKISASIYNEGMGSLFITRTLPTGELALGVFLLDIYCLGVKNSYFNIVDKSSYQTFLSKNPNELNNIEISCAKKMVEGSIDYASELGFKPNKDYKMAKMIFEDIDSSLCSYHFEYGKEGKPFYIPGPNDSKKLQKSILDKLMKKFGPEGFDYFLPFGLEKDIDFELLRNNERRMVEYNITWDTISDEKYEAVPDEVKDEVSILYASEFRAKGSTDRLYELIELYPEVPQFFNYLYIALKKKGKENESIQMLKTTISKFPDYLFAKMNLAQELMDRNNFESIPDLFENKLELSLILPERETFNISEFMGFQAVIARYFNGIGKREAAETVYNMMNEVGVDHNNTKGIRSLLYP